MHGNGHQELQTIRINISFKGWSGESAEGTSWEPILMVLIKRDLGDSKS